MEEAVIGRFDKGRDKAEEVEGEGNMRQKKPRRKKSIIEGKDTMRSVVMVGTII